MIQTLIRAKGDSQLFEKYNSILKDTERGIRGRSFSQ